MNSDVGFNLFISTNDFALDTWNNFVATFKQNRFFTNREHDLLKIFVNEITKTPYNMGDKVYYRARINKEGECFKKDSDLHAPEEVLVGIGRLNPRRMRYLYVAEHPRTVISEVRPWTNATVTIATCKPKRELKVIDFVPSKDDLQRVNSFRRILSENFSRPVRPDAVEIDYLPTQCIAEYVKERFDGVRYSSSVHPGGVNYCLFDPECMDIKIDHEMVIKGVDYSY